MRSVASCLFLFVFLTWSGVVRSDDGTLINTTSGQIQCFVKSLGEFHPSPVARNCLGVPFAAPPLDDLRFAPPVAPQSWSGVRNATSFSPACMQSANGLAWSKTGPEPLSEDCLYLNVYAPLVNVTPPAGGFPVMVFLYGGCWEFGSAAFPFYVGDDMEEYSDKVVLVSVNYRLGAFGFLGSEALRASDGSTGNYGVQDQRLALQWVQDNIEQFNGDPSKVMLFGQSAGSGSTAFHVASKRSSGLFHAATFESGPYTGWSALNMTIQETHYDLLVNGVGCQEGGDPVQQVSCLRSVSADDILHHYEDGALDITSGCSWAPTIDGVELVVHPQFQVQSGHFNRVPVMLGSNVDEGSTFSIDCDSTDQEYWAWLNETGGPDLGTLVYYQYPASDYKSPFWAASEVVTDACFACPARRSARWLSTPTPGTKPGKNVYLYQFQHQPDVSAPDRCLGVFHGAELPFVFYDKKVVDEREKDLAKNMVNWWQSMATNGDPNFDGAPLVWPSYDPYDDQYAAINLKSSTQSGLKHDACDWWDALYAAHIELC